MSLKTILILPQRWIGKLIDISKISCLFGEILLILTSYNDG